MDNSQIKKYILLLELPLDKAISLDDIKRAYRRLSKKYHPDTASVEYKDGKKFTELTRAKDYLIDNLDYVNRIIANGQINSTYSSSYSPFNIFDDNNDEFEDFDFSWFGTFYREQQRRHAEEERKRKAEEERKRREAEEKRRKEEYERRQREEAERKYQYSLKKTAILNDIKAIHSSLKKEDYFVNDYTQINEDIMTFTRNVNNNIYSNIEGLTNAYNNLINKIKSIKTISQVKAQKRRRNTIVSCLSAIAAVVVFVVLLFEIILPTINYNKAVDLLEQNKYEEAGEIFEELDDFKDSNEQVVIIDNELKYRNAVNLLNNNQLTEAKQIFVELNGYRDSNEKINAIDLELDYLQALDYYNNKNFSSAKLYFEKTPGYKQTAEYYSSVLNELEYIEATSLFEKRKYSEAQQKFETLNGFRDSNFYAKYINALELESAKKYLEAKEIFIELGSFKDSVLKANSLSTTIENSYSAIRTYLQNNKYNKAVSLAEEIGVSVSYSYNLNGTADSNNLEGYAKIPSKKGYAFTSWDTLSYALNTDEATLTLDLSAEYNIITYNISYVDVRGDYDSTPITQYTIQESVTLPKVQHAGYTFLGWYENDNRIDNIIQGTIGDITLTAKYEAKQFTIRYDFKNGNAQESQLVTYGEEYAVPNPTRVGYSFAGWFNDDIEYEGGIWNATTDKVLVALWTPNKNISYKVNRYLQNVNDDDYTIDVTEELIGTADSSITPEVKDYVGFTSPVAQTVNIVPDGTLVVDYYYTRNYYEINMVSNGGDKIDTIRKKYQSELNMSIAIRNGYTFGGWYTEQTQLNAFESNTMPSESITLYAHWLEESKACDFTYTGTESYTITGYVGKSNTMTIPSYIGNVPVTTIQGLAFENATITKAIVPDSITEIGQASFKGCCVLEDITLPFVGAKAGITSSDTYQYPLGYIFGTASYEGGTATSQYYYGYRLSSTKTTTYYIPTALKSITINGNHILYGAFSNCNNLTNITIGSSIKNISQAFGGCSSLCSVNISDLSSWYGITFSNESANPLYYAKKLYLNGELVTNLDVPNKVTEIKNYTFSGCTSITNVIIDGDTTSIGTYAFNGCSELRELKLGDAVLNIQHGAFYNCTKLDSLTLGNKLESIGSYAFRGCTSLANIVIPNSVTSIGDYAFYNCMNIKNIIIPDSVKTLGGSIFARCSSLEAITMPFFGEKLFGEYFGTEHYDGGVTIEQRRSDRWGAFSYTTYYLPAKLQDVNITSGSIGFEAFYNCKNIKNVIIGDKVTNVEESAFNACSSLESITLSFTNLNKGLPEEGIYPLGYMFGDSSYDGSIAILQSYRYSVSHIAQKWFYIPSTLRTVIIKGESVPYGAFYGCNNINNVVLADTITSIGTSAFYNCSTLSSVYIPETTTQIEANAFYGCKNVEVYFSGTKEQWDKIVIGNGNTILSTATIHYEYRAQEE